MAGPKVYKGKERVGSWVRWMSEGNVSERKRGREVRHRKRERNSACVSHALRGESILIIYTRALWR